MGDRGWVRIMAVAWLPAALIVSMLLGSGCESKVGCVNESNCAPGYACVDGACEPSSGATPTGG